MAQFTRIEVVQKMKETGLIPVFYNPDFKVCKKVLTASYHAGVRVFEFTNRGDFANEIFNELVKYARKELPDMILGIGSIVDASTASLYIQSGANFIVCPILNEDIAKTCNRRKIAWMPGCGSLTEISKAEELGAEVVKIFPASQVGGPGFVKAVKGPCPWTSIMPTGGVTLDPENLKEWFDAGVHCVGIGSQLLSKQVIASVDEAEMQKQISNAYKAVQKVKSA